MNTIRCGHCARNLGEGEYISLAIKCPRCGTLNHFTIPLLESHALRTSMPASIRQRIPVWMPHRSFRGWAANAD
ncbi:Com family DNA-binding transcriptional regulator [Glaciimonas sp. CA11.2]|uniref:Com family DNA-binding transcriptional regulator n=1 Tax=Glaciimonas sp. CA11.2 TaxID=3048601 RepID=UPI002AB367CC|nr:Com family DNA-binding transcriptional regulator [Glaciimonas sp. CA11.2]MDY7547271.1 Com family DNA-binding transcriptional regulator [Glaciimonas sp. CA11.2]MEB0162391.1 Com family DNA-binding transcriptional regulator [Glaciimonas sp. CA11.2]